MIKQLLLGKKVKDLSNKETMKSALDLRKAAVRKENLKYPGSHTQRPQLIMRALVVQ